MTTELKCTHEQAERIWAACRKDMRENRTVVERKTDLGEVYQQDVVIKFTNMKAEALLVWAELGGPPTDRDIRPWFSPNTESVSLKECDDDTTY